MTIVELRNSILSISNNDLLGALPIFAAAKVIAPYLKPEGNVQNGNEQKGNWTHADEALRNVSNLFDHLNRVGNPFDVPRLEIDGGYQDLVNSVVSALRDMSLSDFLHAVFPEIVPDPKYLAKELTDCGFKKKEYEAYAVMQAKLEWTLAENEATFFSFPNAKKIAKDIVSYKKDWEGFKYAVNCYPLGYKQRISSHAHTVVKLLRNHGLSFRERASLFCETYCRHNSPAATGDEQSLVIGASSNNLPNVRKAFKEVNPYIGKITKATDCLKELWTETPEADDSSIALGFYLRRILADTYAFSSALVINPSPDFLEQANRGKIISRMTFVVPLIEAIPVLKLQFPNAKFLSIEDFVKEAEGGTQNYDYAWLFCQELQKKEISSLIQNIHLLLKDDGRFYAELPSNAVTYQDASKKAILHTGFTLQKIHIFGKDTFTSSPKKRVLVSATKGMPSSRIALSRYAIEQRGKIRFLVEDRSMQANISLDDLMTSKAVSKILSDAVRTPNQERSSAKEIKFLPDISIWITTLEEKDVQNAYRVRGYVSSIPTRKQLKRKLRKKGKKLDTYEVTSPPLAKEDIDAWCISKLPYKSRIKAGIKEALDNAKPDTLSLRTLWYLNTAFSNKWFDRARNIWELALFASDVGLLTGKEESEAFVSCVDHYLDQINADFKDRLRAWRIIHEVCAYGVSRGVMKSNPATTKYSELYSLTDNTEYADIRETLVKKAFELVYESKLIDYLLAKVKKNPEWIFVLIRFLTGLSAGIVAALHWEDIKQIPYCDNAFHFLVRREIDKSGNVKKFVLVQQFRQFPIMPLLKEVLDARRKEILSSGVITSHALAKMPIIATDAQLASGKCVYFKLHTLKKLEKEAIAILQLQDTIVTLPKKDGGVEQKNLTKYQGDRFLSNFKYRARFTAGFLEREVNYLCGLRQKGTYDRHYCDYTNPFIQSSMYVKLLRWDAVLRNMLTSQPVARNTLSLSEKRVFSINGTQTADIEFPFTGKVSIEVESQNGLDLCAIMEA